MKASTEKYHPFRYVARRSFAKQVSSYWRTAVGATMLPPGAALSDLSEIVLRGYNSALDDMPRLERPANSDIAMDELQRAMTYGMFCANGRNIFDFDADLALMFKNTDIGDVPSSSLRLPYPIFYVAFGAQKDLELERGRWVDGAYVMLQNPGAESILHIELSTTSGHPIARGNSAFISDRDPNYRLAINVSEDRPLSEALDQALAEAESSEFSESIEQGIQSATPDAESVGIELRSVHKEGAKRRVELMRLGYPVFRDAMRLVVNALCYLTAYPDSASLEWPADAPKSLTRKADLGKTPTEKRRAESKLLPMGFTRISFCRVSPLYAQQNRGVTGETVRQHWRRGHWRNQPYGKGRSLRKLIWIMPVLIHGNVTVEGTPGHIYSVD